MTTVLTTGCYDLFHFGHLRHLQACRVMGGQLVVLLDSDARIKRTKGPERPFIPQAERLAIVRELSCVTTATVFDFDGDIERAIKHFEVDILIASREYADGGQVIGAEVVVARGGRVAFTERTDGVSTSLIIERIRNGSSYNVGRSEGVH